MANRPRGRRVPKTPARIAGRGASSSKRAAPLPRRDVPPAFARMYGDLDPSLARDVAEHIDVERPRSQNVTAALDFYGHARGFGRRKGFVLLKAGRVLARLTKKRER